MPIAVGEEPLSVNIDDFLPFRRINQVLQRPVSNQMTVRLAVPRQVVQQVLDGVYQPVSDVLRRTFTLQNLIRQLSEVDPFDEVGSVSASDLNLFGGDRVAPQPAILRKIPQNRFVPRKLGRVLQGVDEITTECRVSSRELDDLCAAIDVPGEYIGTKG